MPLMVSQVAGSLALLVIVGALSLGIQSKMGIQAGFNARNLYLVSLDPIRDGYPKDRVGDFFDKLLDRIQKLPVVTSASLTETIPVSLPSQGVTVARPGQQDRQILDSAIKHVVGKDYFATTAIPIHLGRAFTREDESNDTPAVIVSEAFVHRLWNGENPIGQRIEIGYAEIVAPKALPGAFDYRAEVTTESRNTYEVIGVAGDVAEGLIVRKPHPAIYFPLRPATYDRPSLEGVTIILRSVPGTDAVSVIEREAAAIDAGVTPFNALSMQEHIEQFMSPLRAAAWTYGLVGLFGLVLASAGLAGMTAYSVTQRGHEIAIRMALGARSRDVIALVVAEGTVLVMIGAAIGMAFAVAGERAISAMSASVGTINSTSSSDPELLVGAPMLIISLSLLACYLPARRSTAINPVVALRQE